jgi:hypothetical protein
MYGGPPHTWQPIPDELVQQGLFDLDTDSPERVAEFVARHGVITKPLRDWFEWWLPLNIPPERPNLDTTGAMGVMHWSECALALRVARALARHWIAYKYRRSLSKAWAKEGLADFAGHKPQNAWAAFGERLNLGLREYRARVEIGVRWSASESQTLFQPQVGLYSALCLQMLNIITEDLPPRECGNENCAHYFVRQQGTAAYGQYRMKGVLYCSQSCAKAHANREYRRRQRQEA